MAFTTDLSTDVGKVRLLLMDMDRDRPIFPDDQMIQTFIGMEGTVYGGAAIALETIASNRAMVLQVMTILDLKTDGVSVSKELRARADQLRNTDPDVPLIQFAEITDNSLFALREKYWKLYIQASAGGFPTS